MTCKDFVEFLRDYLEDELPEEERARFDEHLRICDSCAAYLSNYRDAAELARIALCEPQDAVPEEVPEELVAAILSSRKLGNGGAR